MAENPPGTGPVYGLVYLADVCAPELDELTALQLRAYFLLAATANRENGGTFLLANWQGAKMLRCSESGFRKAIRALVEKGLVEREARFGFGPHETSVPEPAEGWATGPRDELGRFVEASADAPRFEAWPQNRGGQGWNRYRIVAPQTAREQGFIYPRGPSMKRSPLFWPQGEKCQDSQTPTLLGDQGEQSAAPAGGGPTRATPPGTAGTSGGGTAGTTLRQVAQTGDPDSSAPLPESPSPRARPGKGSAPPPPKATDRAERTEAPPRGAQERPLRGGEADEEGRFAAQAYEGVVADLLAELTPFAEFPDVRERAERALERHARATAQVKGDLVRATRETLQRDFPLLPGRRRYIVALWRKVARKVADTDVDVLVHKLRGRAILEREARKQEHARRQADLRRLALQQEDEIEQRKLESEANRAVADELVELVEELAARWEAEREAAELDESEAAVELMQLDNRDRIRRRSSMRWRVRIAQGCLRRLSGLLDGLHKARDLGDQVEGYARLVRKAPTPDAASMNAAEWAGLR